MTKALEAKEAAIIRAEQRTQVLLDRIDQLASDFGGERQAFESKIAALEEELQREKSERAIAQGALEMARRSRVEIHREFLEDQEDASGVERGRGFRRRQRRAAPEHRQARRGLKRRERAAPARAR